MNKYIIARMVMVASFIIAKKKVKNNCWSKEELSKLECVCRLDDHCTTVRRNQDAYRQGRAPGDPITSFKNQAEGASYRTHVCLTFDLSVAQAPAWRTRTLLVTGVTPSCL